MYIFQRINWNARHAMSLGLSAENPPKLKASLKFGLIGRFRVRKKSIQFGGNSRG